jgi:HAD-hyrolase-like
MWTALEAILRYFCGSPLEIGYQEDETFVVGDTPYDAEAATKLGVETIGLRCGVSQKKIFCALAVLPFIAILRNCSWNIHSGHERNPGSRTHLQIFLDLQSRSAGPFSLSSQPRL